MHFLVQRRRSVSQLCEKFLNMCRDMEEHICQEKGNLKALEISSSGVFGFFGWWRALGFEFRASCLLGSTLTA
jgi:hypothetical protein